MECACQFPPQEQSIQQKQKLKNKQKTWPVKHDFATYMDMRVGGRKGYHE